MQNNEPIKGKTIQRFWRFTVTKDLGVLGTDWLFRTDPLTESCNVDKVREELNVKFSEGYTVTETQWDVILIEPKI